MAPVGAAPPVKSKNAIKREKQKKKKEEEERRRKEEVRSDPKTQRQHVHM